MAASSACTMLPGLARYITPSCTSGVVCCDPGSIAQDQTRRRLATLSRVIWSRVLYPHPSCVRRQFSQLSGGGSASTASVTGLTAGAWAATGAARARTASVAIAAHRIIVDSLRPTA